MRNVRLAAIQSEPTYSSGICDWMGEDYCGDARQILERHVKPCLSATFGLLEEAGRMGCAAVTTGEGICGTAGYIADISPRNVLPELLALSAPLAEEGLSDIARRYSMLVVGCYNKRVDGKNYNVASVFNRSGQIVGEYRKTHLPPDETWQMTPGNDLNVIDTEIGRIGVAICYDMMFPEVVEALALRGAGVIFHPTAGYGWYDAIGEATLRVRASDNGVTIVTAKNYRFNGAGKSCVVDHWGHIRADAGFRPNAVVFADIDLDEKKTQPQWYNPTQMSGCADVTRRMRRERRPELYGVISREIHERFQPPDAEKQREIIEKIKKGECRW